MRPVVHLLVAIYATRGHGCQTVPVQQNEDDLTRPRGRITEQANEAVNHKVVVRTQEHRLRHDTREDE
jgi:hypothetical protein